jgi:hypothetical protein
MIRHSHRLSVARGDFDGVHEGLNQNRWVELRRAIAYMALTARPSGAEAFLS